LSGRSIDCRREKVSFVELPCKLRQTVAPGRGKKHHLEFAGLHRAIIIRI